MQTHKHHKVKAETGRCVETLFRVTFSNQIHLIQIADNKANSIITINALIITVLIGLSGYGSVTQQIGFTSMNMILPIILLLLTCCFSVIFALMATQPRFVKSKNKTPGKKSDSLLFFGSIPDRTLDAYLADMDELTHSPDSVYHAMETEIYNQSKVLTRKYRLLRIAFLVFTYGFISTVLAFIISFLFVF
ncbi:MAG TPA: Pycsar system effector family protein [Chitinophagaceae bacterium]|nr:Pycsar system effector family protein [Chitinophagaceae bacterium]